LRVNLPRLQGGLKMPDRCTHLRDFLTAQKIILLRNLEQHKWFRHIADEEEGKDNFIEWCGWLMREIYCGFICCDRFDCAIAHDYLPQAPNQSNPVPLDILELAIQEVIRKHLDEHKYFRHIDNTEEAKRDFLNEFGGIIREMISNFGPKTCSKSSLPETSGDEQKDSV
jgi:hypothetical protein